MSKEQNAVLAQLEALNTPRSFRYMQRCLEYFEEPETAALYAVVVIEAAAGYWGPADRLFCAGEPVWQQLYVSKLLVEESGSSKIDKAGEMFQAVYGVIEHWEESPVWQ